MRLLFLLVFMVILVSGNAQPKGFTAIRTSQPPKIDGQLDEDVWKQAAIASDFIQYFPTAHAKATVKTEVRFLYDDDALYIGAHLLDDPSQIRRQLTARDGEQQADVDYFSIFIDTYNDHQNGFQFLVTAANVQSDAKLSGSSSILSGNYGDKSWDAVWQSKTSITSDGWIAEVRIPYFSIRFADQEIQTWGVQFLRFLRRNTESSFWNPVNPNLSGFVNQFGTVQQIQNIRPPLRLSFSPYLSGGFRSSPDAPGKNSEFLRSGGMDVKFGVNESFTLDATLIPDFGQVVSDNIVNNLSPFEVRFQENRPFFTEGTELFNKAGLFYSRRIGSTPAKYDQVADFSASNPDWQVKKNLSVTQLYNATKFSGRTEQKLGIGVFNAVTAPMKAHLINTASKSDSVIQTEPLTNYSIIVLDQAFKGRSYITLTNTNVMREGRERDANVSALDFAVYNKTNTYSLSGTARISSVKGLSTYTGFTSTVFDTVHMGNASYVTPYNGYNARLRLAKISGKWHYSVAGKITSDKFDPNDLGYQQFANNVNYQASASYNQYQPTRLFYNYLYSINVTANWLYKPYAFADYEVNASGIWVFKNMWDLRLTIGGEPLWKNDYFELRTPGRYVKLPNYFYVVVGGSTDSRKRLFADYEFVFAEASLPNNPYFTSAIGVRYRFSNKFSLSLNGERKHDKSQIGYAFRREANGAPIIGFREYKEVSTIFSGIYNFTPRMNVTLRGRHYWSAVTYQNFYNVTENGSYNKRPFIPGQDFNFGVFNVDAFYTWDFRPGSRVIIGWKNWLGNNYSVLQYDRETSNYYRNFKNTFSLPHGNELTLRVIYFLDYNQLRR